MSFQISIQRFRGNFCCNSKQIDNKELSFLTYIDLSCWVALSMYLLDKIIPNDNTFLHGLFGNIKLFFLAYWYVKTVSLSLKRGHMSYKTMYLDTLMLQEITKPNTLNFFNLCSFDVGSNSWKFSCVEIWN